MLCRVKPLPRAVPSFISPETMRLLLLFLIASCLSLLSFQAAASSRADGRMGNPLRTGALVCSMTSVAAMATAAVKAAMADSQAFPDEDEAGIVAPGDDGLEAEMAAQAPERPGYCNIWSADLLDPPDVLDEIEESSALFAVPMARLELPSDDVTEFGHGSAPPLPAALYKPPIFRL